MHVVTNSDLSDMIIERDKLFTKDQFVDFFQKHPEVVGMVASKAGIVFNEARLLRDLERFEKIEANFISAVIKDKSIAQWSSVLC